MIDKKYILLINTIKTWATLIQSFNPSSHRNKMNYYEINFKKYSCKNLADVGTEALSQKTCMKTLARVSRSRN